MNGGDELIIYLFRQHHKYKKDLISSIMVLEYTTSSQLWVFDVLFMDMEEGAKAELKGDDGDAF